MLEIIAIIALVRKNGRICKEKNIKPGIYQFLTVILWVGLEFTGAFLGALAGVEGIGLYLGALAGAGLGALISYLIVNSLDHKAEISETLDGQIVG